MVQYGYAAWGRGDDDLIGDRFRRVDATMYEMRRDPDRGMRVPARVYADERLWPQISSDRSLGQLVNVSALPGASGAVYAMPDAHEGYGLPVGGVAAFRTADGVISPGGVGYDINCGVRLLSSNLSSESVHERLPSLVREPSRSIPSGKGRGGELVLSDAEMDRVFVEGCHYLVERGMATEDDVAHTESEGRLADADPDAISARAGDRGRGQLGSMGSGNHFVEVERVERIVDHAAAEALGLWEGQGATRAFGPGHPETPRAYRGVGQPVFIPGSMGTGSWVLVGAGALGDGPFGSACHGAGRRMSRGQARRTAHGRDVMKDLTSRGIIVHRPSMKELAEETPYAYKDVDSVVDVVDRAGLARKVAFLATMGVVKG